MGRNADVGIEEFDFYWAREEAPALGADASWTEHSLDRATLDWLNDETIPAIRADRGEARARC